MISFLDAKERFLALNRWRPNTKKVLVSNLSKFGWQRSLSKIAREDVLEVLGTIKGPAARAHALKDLRCFFNWCIPTYLDASPCAGLKAVRQPSRERVLTPEEIRAVWLASEGTLGIIVKLLLLTGQRKMEIGLLRGDYLKGDLVTLPSSLVKNGRQHTFPIGSLAPCFRMLRAELLPV